MSHPSEHLAARDKSLFPCEYHIPGYQGSQSTRAGIPLGGRSTSWIYHRFVFRLRKRKEIVAAPTGECGSITVRSLASWVLCKGVCFYAWGYAFMRGVTLLCEGVRFCARGNAFLQGVAKVSGGCKWPSGYLSLSTTYTYEQGDKWHRYKQVLLGKSNNTALRLIYSYIIAI